MHGTGPYDSHPTSIHKKRDNKNYRSQHTFNLDKISQAEGRSLQELLGDISVPGPKVRGSIDSSFMKIEVDDLDVVPTGLSSVNQSRAQTSNVIGGYDMSLNIEPVINSRYGQAGKRNH